MGIPVAGAANQWLTNLKQHQLAAQVNNEQDYFRGSSINPAAPDLSQGYNAGFQDTLGLGSNYSWNLGGPGRLDLPTLGPTAILAPAPQPQPKGGTMAKTNKTQPSTTPAAPAPVSTGVSGWVWLILLVAVLYFLE